MGSRHYGCEAPLSMQRAQHAAHPAGNVYGSNCAQLGPLKGGDAAAFAGAAGANRVGRASLSGVSPTRCRPTPAGLVLASRG